MTDHTPAVRTGQSEAFLTRREFTDRFNARFRDPKFDQKRTSIAELEVIAWDAYKQARKSPQTRIAGNEFKDPTYELSVDWLKAREAVASAQRHHDNPEAGSRVLLVCASARNDKTCPGEESKTFRLCQTALSAFKAAGVEADLLDLSTLTSEYGKAIHPCKGCVSTAMPLCHWPCSCYPNHALGQSPDWMNEIYPLWVAAHGIMIITPVYWYQAPAVLKLMIDRLVCADGGNPDPTSTHGKKAAEAKKLELAGWDYPRHLAGRSYALLVHGDAAGAENLRRSLADWLNDMQLLEAGAQSCLDRYIGYYGPYASSHEALDEDRAIQTETHNAATALARQVVRLRGVTSPRIQEFPDPRPK